MWATVERNPVGPNTFGAEEVAEFIDSLESGGPPSAVRWLSDYLESIRAIYAIRIYPEAILNHPDALDAVYAIRTALHDAVGGMGQWDGQGFTNEDDRLIWCDRQDESQGKTRAAMLDESTGEWIDFDLNLEDRDEMAAFLRGEISLRQLGSNSPLFLIPAPSFSSFSAQLSSGSTAEGYPRMSAGSRPFHGAWMLRLVKMPRPSSSAANGFVDVFTAATPSFISSGKGTSRVGNEVQCIPSWLNEP